MSAAAGLFLSAASNQAMAAPLQPVSAGMVDAAAKPLGILAPAARAAVNTLNTVATADKARPPQNFFNSELFTWRPTSPGRF